MPVHDALARVLHSLTDGLDGEGTATWPDPAHREVYALAVEEVAQATLADPGPLLEALAEAGVLHRQSRRLQRGGPREVRYATVEPDGRRDGGDGLATEWRPTNARP